MTVGELIKRLKEFDENAEIEFQQYCVDWCYQYTIPTRWIDLYEDEDENGYRTDKVIIDLWNDK